jgi:hypothetical protein
LHEAGLLTVITQDRADFPDGGVDTVLGVYEDFAVPEALGDLSSGDQLAISCRQQNEQLHGLSFQLQTAS